MTDSVRAALVEAREAMQMCLDRYHGLSDRGIKVLRGDYALYEVEALRGAIARATAAIEGKP